MQEAIDLDGGTAKGKSSCNLYPESIASILLQSGFVRQ